MSGRHLSIKWKFMLFCMLLVTVSVVALGVLNYRISEREIYSSVERNLEKQVLMLRNHIETAMELTQQKVNSDLKVAHDILYSYGTPTLNVDEPMKVQAINQITKKSDFIEIPTMSIQGETISNNFQIVDRIQSLVGGTATIFQMIPQGTLRISTNVLKLDGNRAVGTYIPANSPVYATVMRGETFYGRAYVVNAWYQTAYEPIKDENGAIIGILYVGVEDASEPILNNLADIVIGKTGYIWIINKTGKYVLSQKRQRDGENLWDMADSEGRLFIQEWITTASSPSTEAPFIDYYPWQNAEEKSARQKIAAFTYFPDWEWLIGAGTYVEDFQDSLKKIKTLTFFVSCIAISVGSAIAYLLALLIVNPMLKSVEFAKSLAEGDLSAQITVSQKDETGVLAKALQDMQDRIQDVLKETMRLIQAIQEGDLDCRSDATAFHGGWHELITGVNNVVDAFVTPFNAVAEYLARMSKGDIPEQIRDEYKGDFNELKSNLNQLIQSLQSIIGEISGGTTVLLDSVQNLTASSQEVSTTSNEQAAAVKEIVSTMEDSDELAKSIATQINDVTKITTTTKSVVNGGFVIISNSLSKMNEIKDANAEMITEIKALGNKVESIWEIVNMINDIANQTKIIAFNAELEASSAGDAGKNFQIVASEIRRLADGTVASTNEIKTKINEIQQSSDSLILTSEEGTSKISEGWELSNNLQKLFEHILHSADVSADASDRIALSIKQQVSAFEQILLTLKQIAEGIDSFVVSSQATTTTAEKFRETADSLHAVIEEYSGDHDRKYTANKVRSQKAIKTKK